MLKRIGLKKLLLFFVITVGVVSLCSAGLSLFTNRKAVNELSDASRRGLTHLAFKSTLLKSFSILQTNIQATLYEQDKDSVDLRVEVVDGYFKEFDKLMSSCTEGCDKYKDMVAQYQKVWNQIKPLMTTGHKAEAQDYSAKNLIPLSEKTFDQVDKELSALQKEINHDMDASVEASHRLQMILGIGVLAITILLVFLGIVFRHWVNKGLDSVTQSLFQNTQEANEMTQALTTSSESLSRSSEQQAASVEETSASIQEISSMVQMNADNSKVAATLSEECANHADRGGKDINQLISTMREIHSFSKKIEEITSVIEDIAFQTNLLALNAAVEAARAGEQGKGFAVVADAVRSLAQKSTEATKEINDLIQSSSSKVEEGTRMADLSGAALDQIISSVQRMSVLNKEIAQASNEQAVGLNEVTKAMNSIDQIVQNNASISIEVSSASQRMSKQAVNLQMSTEDLKSLLYGLKHGFTQSEAVYLSSENKSEARQKAS